MTHHPPDDQATLAAMALFPEMNPGPVIRTDLSGRIKLANSVAMALFGADGLIGRDWREICRQVDGKLWSRALGGEDMLHQEAAIGERVFSFTYRRAPEVPFVFIYGSDITERKRNEALLAEQSARIAEMARFPDMNPGPVLRLDRDARVILANAAALEVFGEAVRPGECWLDICPGLDGDWWQKVLASTGVVPIETTLGASRYVFAHRRTASGDMVFVYGNDVTQLRAAEEALRQSEKMAMLGTLAAGVAHELNNPAAAVTRGAGHLPETFAALQEAFVALSRLQLTPERIARLMDLVRADKERVVKAAMIDPLTRSDTESEVEDWLAAKGMPDPWLIAGSLVSLGYDVDELESLELEWGADLPAVAIWIGRAQPVFALAREIEEAARRISDIVRALKSYSYVGQAPVRAVDVTEGLESTLVMLRAKLRNITVERVYAPGLPLIDAHGSELNQVWTNLIDNAVQAIGATAQGKIVIRTRLDRDCVVVEIEDDGPGIPAAILPKIFDPFFTTKDPGKGTGLGLSTSKNIVEKKHGGAISVTSRPGCTRFIVRLPLGGSTSAAGASARPAATTSSIQE